MKTKIGSKLGKEKFGDDLGKGKIVPLQKEEPETYEKSIENFRKKGGYK